MTAAGGAWEALAALASEAGALLRARAMTAATAESLTGGWISAALTAVPGASEYFLGGLCAYSNQAKISALGVDPETISGLGAVSPQCSRQMARGARALFGADLAVASTGIAGPTGATPLKPVGLAYLTVVDSTRFLTVESRLAGGRLEVSTGAALEALTLLARFLSER
jgi:PncC family amidohydrolase